MKSLCAKMSVPTNAHLSFSNRSSGVQFDDLLSFVKPFIDDLSVLRQSNGYSHLLKTHVKPSFTLMPHIYDNASLQVRASRFPKNQHILQGLSGHERLSLSKRCNSRMGISVYERFGGRGGRDLEG